MIFKKWICLLLFVAGSVLPSVALDHHTKIATPTVLADGGAPPAPPIPYGKTYSA